MARYIALFLLLCSSLVNAAEDRNPTLIALVQERTGLKAHSVAKGRFGPKGEQYVAAVASPIKDDGSVQIVLFPESEKGAVHVLHSKPWSSHPNAWWQVSFGKGGLELSNGQSCGAVCLWTITYTFRYRRGDYRLVDAELSRVSADRQEKDGVVKQVFLVSTDKSIDLEGSTVEHSIERCPTSENAWSCTSKGKAARKKLSFASDVKWTLSNFSYDDFLEFEEATHDLRGSFDANLQFRGATP